MPLWNCSISLITHVLSVMWAPRSQRACVRYVPLCLQLQDWRCSVTIYRMTPRPVSSILPELNKKSRNQWKRTWNYLFMEKPVIREESQWPCAHTRSQALLSGLQRDWTLADSPLPITDSFDSTRHQNTRVAQPSSVSGRTWMWDLNREGYLAFTATQGYRTESDTTEAT